MFGKKKHDRIISTVSSRNDSSQIQVLMEPIAEKEMFEPLPEPVDFSNIKPTTRYQFRGMARRALSYHPDLQLWLFYIPSPDWGWNNQAKISNEYQEMVMMEYMKNPELYSHMLSAPQPFALNYDVQGYNQTVYYSTADADVARILGTSANVTRRFRSEPWPSSDSNITLFNTSHIDPANGLLGAIPLRYKQGKEQHYEFNNGIGERLTVYSTTPTYRYFESRESAEEVNLAWDKGNFSNYGYADCSHQPFGVVYFDALDVDKTKVSMTMQLGSDSYSDYKGTDGVRQIIVMSQITNALARLKFRGQYIISQGIRALPFEFQWDRLNNRAAGLSSTFMFPFALSFLLPSFVTVVVQEKEGRHRMMMAMNELGSGAYYLTHYVEFMIMQLILTIFFVIAVVSIKNDLLWDTNPGLITLLFLLWAHVQTTLSFFLASLFSRSRRASLFIYFVIALSVILASMSDMIFTEEPPFAWFIHPTFSFFYIVKKGMMQATMVNNLYPLRFSDFTAGFNSLNCIFLLLGESILFVLLTFYVDTVMPSEYGVRRPWYFPITSLFKSRSSKPALSRDIESKMAQGGSHIHHTAIHDQESMDGGDDDVHAERDRVRSQYDSDTTPLIIDNLFHCYPGKVEPALKGMSFGVKNNTVLNLLCPNGAGKSTLIHLLT
ncbi:hypothetical protein BGZ96_003609, partial [Linnemannia gamsii]